MTVLPFGTAADWRAASVVVGPHLAAGGVLGHPTETVYGLGGRPVDADLESLLALKGRGRDKPVLLLVASRGMAEDAGLEFGSAATAHADACWPGPLTLVLPCRDSVLPRRLRGASGGVGVRWTSHEGMAALIEDLGYPITSTSANRPGAPSANAAASVERDFGGGARLLVLDGGSLPASAPSTVVDCTAPDARLLREGVLTRAELERRVGRWSP